MKVEYSRYNSVLFIDSKINQLLVTQCIYGLESWGGLETWSGVQ